MKIDVKITSFTPNEGNLKAIASVNLDDCFAVKNLKVVEGRNGLFVSMPSYRGQDDEYHDICFPITAEMRTQLNDAVIGAYWQTLEQMRTQQSYPNYTQARQPVQTGQPMQTRQPAQTGQPMQAGQPAQTGQPMQTRQPMQAGQPMQTGQPAQTNQPMQTGQQYGPAPTGSM